jgi:hypothetical protein
MLLLFDQLYGHPQAILARKIKITINSSILGDYEISVCYTININKI